MHSGSGEEETAIIGGGREGGHRQGFQRLWAPPGDGDLLQIPRAGDLGDIRQLAGGGEELGPGEDGVEEDVEHTQQGGSDASGVRIIFKGCDTGGTAIWSGYLYGNPPHGQCPGGVS